MAARTLFQWGPEDFRPNAGTFGDPSIDGQSRAILGVANAETFDTPAFIAPQTMVTPLTAVITYRMATAATNAVEMRCTVEAITDGDALDTDAASSFAADNDSGDITVPATQGHIDQFSITLTNNDSVAIGDLCRLRFTRISPAGAEAAGDMDILCIELRDNGA
jgi:hypothetical protein